MKCLIASALSMLGVVAAQAKTVAYWPLNYDSNAAAWQYRSVAGPFTLEAVGTNASVTGGRTRAACR